MKKKISVIIWILLGAAAVIGLIMSNINHKNLKCKGVEIKIDYKDADPFFTEDEIIEYIKDKALKIEGEYLKNLNEQYIEEIIDNYPYVYKSNAFLSLDGTLKLQIVQRKPIVRIINKFDQQFYLDSYGVKMPVSEKYTANVPIASGYINSIYAPFSPDIKNNRSDTLNLINDSILYNIYKVANFVSGNKFFYSLIEQIYVNQRGDIELIPKFNEHIIILGDAENIEEKFFKLDVFYKNALKETGWDKYKTINLKYENQVVCTKNE
jgi:cell division protein FtsQ